MKAIVQNGHGGPEVLTLSEVDRPTIKDDEVLVRVRAASVGAWDWHVMRGEPRIMGITGQLKPKNGIAGLDFAGEIEDVGKDVADVRPGDEVYGETEGAFAEYVAAADDSVAQKPTNLSFEYAASVPVAGVTALMGLQDVGEVQPGQKVLIVGAGGGVGSFAVQIAASMGAHVTGVCSTGSVDLVRSLGADEVIDYTEEGFSENGERYDVIFELAGTHPLSAYRASLTPTGTLVMGNGSGGRWFGPLGHMAKAFVVSPFVKQRFIPFVGKTTRERLATLRDLIETGKVAPIIDRTYALDEVPQAIAYVEREHHQGKTVVTVP